MAGIDTRAIAAADLAREDFPNCTHEFRVFVAQEPFDALTTRGAADLTREVGGVLVGRVLRDEGGPFVRVDATIDALHAEEKGTELTFTHATWDHVHREMEKSHAGRRIVGWWHTHPGFSVFLSDRDQFIHRSFFNLPFQVALVFDPKNREHGVFAWRDNEPVRVRRYWIGDREHVWDGAHPVAPRVPEAAAQKETSMTDERRRDDGAVPDWFTGALGVVALLVVGAFAGWWLGQRGAAESLAQAEAVGARRLAEGFNTDLVNAVRRALDEPGRRARMDAALAELEAASKAQGADATKRIESARAAIRQVRDEDERTAGALRLLEENVRSSRIDAEAMRIALQEHGAILAQFCALSGDAAAKAGDVQQARQLYEQAARLDPARASLYRALGDKLAPAGPR